MFSARSRTNGVEIEKTYMLCQALAHTPGDGSCHAMPGWVFHGIAGNMRSPDPRRGPIIRTCRWAANSSLTLSSSCMARAASRCASSNERRASTRSFRRPASSALWSRRSAWAWA
jgi:hypothetical protein